MFSRFAKSGFELSKEDLPEVLSRSARFQLSVAELRKQKQFNLRGVHSSIFGTFALRFGHSPLGMSFRLTDTAIECVPEPLPETPTVLNAPVMVFLRTYANALSAMPNSELARSPPPQQLQSSRRRSSSSSGKQQQQ